MINTDVYKGHTPGPWVYNTDEGRAIWKELFNGECFTDPSTYGRPGYEEVVIATMAPLPEDGEDFPEEEFTTMMANKMLMADAPLILQALIDERAEVKRLREAFEETVYSWRDKPWGVMGHTIAIALRNAGEDILNILYGGDEE